MGNWDGPGGQTLNSEQGGSVANYVPPAGGLAQRHFVLQDRRPPHLGDVGLGEMDPFLRGLLFTDGTVTRTLEVQALSRVSVEVVDQIDTVVSGQSADHLRVTPGTASVRRRVLIGTGESAGPAIWAESQIIPSRLPSSFLSVLEGTPDGIGESLQRVELESCREMLWFGIDSHPKWSGVESDRPPVITRLYRVIAGGLPTLLISESFSIMRRDGAYCLSGMETSSD